MKKLLTLLATMMVAVTLSMPVFAHGTQAEGAAQSAPAKKHAKKHTEKKEKKATKKSKKQKKQKKQKTTEAAGQ